MTVKYFNVKNGLSAGNITLDADSGNTSTTNLSVTGKTDLNDIANVTITGGTDGYVLSTDGSGNLSFINPAASQSPAPMPIVVDAGNTLTIAANYQGLFGYPLTINGDLVVDGVLVDVNDNGGGTSGPATALNATISNVVITGGVSGYYLQTDGTGNLSWAAGGGGGSGSPGGVNTQVQFNDAGTFGGNAGFTFNKTTGVFAAPNIVVTGNITPSANVTYSLGNNTNRFNNLYLAGNTIILGNSTISANATSLIFTNPDGGNFVISGSTTQTLGNIANVNLDGSSSNVLYGNGVFAPVSGGGGSYGNSNVATFLAAYGSNTITTTGNVTVGNIIGNGQALTGINGANITGAVAYATTANSVAGANVSGQVNYAATANSVAGANVTGAVAYATTANSVAGANVSGAVALATYATTANNVAGANVSGQVNYAATANSVAGANVVGAVGLASYASIANSVAGANVSGEVSYAATANSVAGANVSGEVGYAATANSVAGANVTGTVSSATTAGTVTTAAQPNITSTGTLASLSVSGNANIGNIGSASGVFTANVNANNITTTNKITAGNGLQVSDGSLSVVNGNLDVTGNINVTGNLNYSNVTDLVVGDPLIYIGANNTGDTVDLGIVGSYNEGTYYHTGIARNSTTNYWTFFDGVVAEPTTVIDWANAVYPTVKLGNLIATGTLSSTGNANVGNIGAINGVFTNVSGNGSALSSITGANVTGAVAYATTANSVAAANVSGLGNIATINLDGSSSNVLYGNGVFAPAAGGSSGSNISNGSSNVSIATVNGNVTTSVGGVSNVLVVTTTGANITGTFSASGNANVGNLATTGQLNVGTDLFVGNGAASTTFVNPIAIFKDAGATYVQVAVVNSDGNGSADLTVYGNNGSDTQSWADMGFTGNTFNDANYTVTGPGDGYFFVQGNASFGGNMVIATGNTGTTKDIIFATGGFLTGNIKARLFNANGAFTVGGNVVGGNLVTGGALSATGNANVGNLGTAGLITATGNLNAGNIITGGVISATGNANVGNIGATTAIFTTGNITTINSGLLQNGNSNVTITSNGNVTINAVGGARIVATSTGANVTGTLSASGNINGGNLSVSGTVIANGITLGYLGAPLSGADKTTSYTLATPTDLGKIVSIGSGGSVTIPNATFSAGDTISVFNNTAANATITCSTATAYIAGNNTSKASVTLATRGIATIVFISGTICVITGSVS